jgi:hypothetical protein
MPNKTGASWLNTTTLLNMRFTIAYGNICCFPVIKPKANTPMINTETEEILKKIREGSRFSIMFSRSVPVYYSLLSWNFAIKAVEKSTEIPNLCR